MKLFYWTALTCVAVNLAKAYDTNDYTFAISPGATIPDGNPTGIAEAFDVSGIVGTLNNLQLTVDITGGFNGALYAYLEDPSGNFAILLNRAGVTASDSFGYSDSGFSITFDDSGANVHDYQSGSYTLNGNGQLTGTWAPDGRNIDPMSSGGTFDSASTADNFGTLSGDTFNGAWTLFIADEVSGGSTPILQNASLYIETVPEPGVWSLLGIGGLALLKWRRGVRN